MATISGIYDYVRIDIGDIDGQILTDNLMDRYLPKAVTRLNGKLGLSKVSRPRGVGSQFGGSRITVPEITIDLSSRTNSPIPDNDEIHNLITLQLTEIVIKAEMHALARLNPSLGGSIGSATSTAVNDDVTVVNADGVRISVSGSRFSNRIKLWQILLERVMNELDEEVNRFLARQSGNFGKCIF